MQTLISYFADIHDPRVDRTKKHPLPDIMLLTLVASLCNVRGWDNIHLFGTHRLDFLRTIAPFKAGIPSADTIRRLFERIDCGEFHAAFCGWVADVLPNAKGVVAIDGKTIKSTKNPIHLVHAWCNSNQGVCLGQVATEEKSNEITAIPKLLDFLSLEDCIVTIDAMGCQKDIAEKIVVDKEADYILAVKGNQPTLHRELIEYFAACEGECVYGARRAQTSEVNRGRRETRTAYVTSDLSFLSVEDQWSGLTTVGLIISNVEKNGKTTEEHRYYISSKNLAAKELLGSVREHWRVENSLHWVLDVTFGEDGNRTVKDNSQENMALVRKIAINLMNDIPDKRSKPQKMLAASQNSDYLRKLLKIVE